MSTRTDAPGDDPTADPFEEFARDNRDWLEEQADSDAPAAWVAQALLDATDGDGE